MEEEPPYWNNIQIHIQEEREPLIESTTADMPSPKKVKSQWFIWDPCGIACVVFTYIFLAYGVLVLLAVVGPAFPDVYTLLATCAFSFLVFLSVVSHVKAMITNPGVVPHQSTTEEEIAERRDKGEEVRYCKKCRSVKPDRAHHCSICEHCIHRMDHHCPWINNCVGENNQKFFVLFTFYVMITSIFGLMLTGWFIFRCVSHNFEGCDAFLPGPLVFIVIILCVFEGFLFSLFTCIMFFTQLHAILTDETGIESLKKENRKRKRWFDSLTEVFGSSPSLQWLSPFSEPPYITLHRSHFQSVLLDV